MTDRLVFILIAFVGGVLLLVSILYASGFVG